MVFGEIETQQNERSCEIEKKRINRKKQEEKQNLLALVAFLVE